MSVSIAYEINILPGILFFLPHKSHQRAEVSYVHLHFSCNWVLYNRWLCWILCHVLQVTGHEGRLWHQSGYRCRWGRFLDTHCWHICSLLVNLFLHVQLSAPQYFAYFAYPVVIELYEIISHLVLPVHPYLQSLWFHSFYV